LLTDELKSILDFGDSAEPFSILIENGFSILSQEANPSPCFPELAVVELPWKEFIGNLELLLVGEHSAAPSPVRPAKLIICEASADIIVQDSFSSTILSACQKNDKTR
jgi:hypothetical protein